MDMLVNWQKIEKKIRFILIRSLILSEETDNVSILEIYDKYLHKQKLSEKEMNILEMFDYLCYYQAINPIFDNPIAKGELGELALDNEEEL